MATQLSARPLISSLCPAWSYRRWF